MQQPREHLTIMPAAGPLTGVITVDPDKSITHRALFFGALNRGATVLRSPSRAADPISTLGLLRAIGYAVAEREDDDAWVIDGGRTPHGDGAIVLDCGNSGTTARLAAGFLTGERGRFILTGDASLMRRPMDRVVLPLRQLGADLETTGGCLPVTIDGGSVISGLEQGMMSVGSAQVHGALVLAALRSAQGATISRVRPMRDHTLRMARQFGVAITERDAGTDHVLPSRIDAHIDLRIPGDLSSAAFMVVAALLVPGSRLRIQGVGLNPTRTAFLQCLAAMHADVRWEITEDGFEPVGWIEAAHSPAMQAIALGDGHPELPVAEMIDELPLLALVAARAHGVTTVNDAAELRLKESDRITATASLLRAFGIEMKELAEGFAIEGPQRIIGGGTVDHHGDHRLCMTAAVAAMAAETPVTVPEPDVAAVSYPGFWRDLEHIAPGSIQRSR